MALFFVSDPELTDDLRSGILDLWVDVTNSGGSVGFVPPVTADDIRLTADLALGGVVRGRSRLVVGLDGDRVRAAGFLERNSHRLMGHWVLAKTVMVHPDLQGEGHGFALMMALAGVARAMPAVEAIRLTARGGEGLEDFYARCGYKEVGRVPDAIRVAPGDDRDEIVMLLSLL